MVVGMLMDEARQSPMYGAGLLMAKGAFRNLRRKGRLLGVRRRPRFSG